MISIDALKKSRCADEICDCYGEISV